MTKASEGFDARQKVVWVEPDGGEKGDELVIVMGQPVILQVRGRLGQVGNHQVLLSVINGCKFGNNRGFQASGGSGSLFLEGINSRICFGGFRNTALSSFVGLFRHFLNFINSLREDIDLVFKFLRRHGAFVAEPEQLP